MPPEELLWSLCQGATEIEHHWIAQPGESGAGSLHFQDPDPSNDDWPFVMSREDGSRWLGAIPSYRQLESLASADPSRALETYAKAALSINLRAHITVTDDSRLLDLDGFYAHSMSAATPADALAVVGLYLRKDDPFLGAWAPNVGLRFGGHFAAWVAVRSQIPSGWRWSAALVQHGSATANDYTTLLHGSFFERLVRMLKHRDNIHRAVLERADNKTGNDATEALDTLMFNVVGAFDAAAIAAHLGAGLPMSERRQAGWQSKDWRKRLCSPQLDQMFHKNKPAQDLFAVCRLFRNTIHGAGLSSMVAARAGCRETLVQLPQADASEVVDRLARLSNATNWGIDDRVRGQLYVDPAQLVEGLVPHIFSTLEQILEHTPLSGLATSGTLDEGIPTRGGFDLRTRSRTALLYGLTPPTR